jgi:hypothetical protein
LEHAPSRLELAGRLALREDVLEPARRRIELHNFLERLVRPIAVGRGRG